MAAKEAEKNKGKVPGSQAGEGLINALGAGLIRIKEDIKKFWEGLKGIGESFVNLVTGKGFNTDDALNERKEYLLKEYDRVKDMSLLAGNGDANLANACQAAAYKEELLNELRKIDPKAADDAHATSQSGIAEASKKSALLKVAVDAALKAFEGDIAKDQNVKGGVSIERDRYGRITGITDENLTGDGQKIYNFDTKGNVLTERSLTFNVNETGKMLSFEEIKSGKWKVELNYDSTGKDIVGYNFYEKVNGAVSGTEDTYNPVNMNERYLNELKDKLGSPYYYGGGQMDRIKECAGTTLWWPRDNKNSDGTWKGYDCCGGIIDSMRDVFGIDQSTFNSFTAGGIFNSGWVKEISKNELTDSDLIFVDYVGDNGTDGVFEHVMTYSKSTNEKGEEFDLITTFGGDSDFDVKAINSGIRGKTVNDVTLEWWQDNYIGSTFKYGRINWGKAYKSGVLKLK